MIQRLFSRGSGHGPSSKHHTGTGKGGVSCFHHRRPIGLPLNLVESGDFYPLLAKVGNSAPSAGITLGLTTKETTLYQWCKGAMILCTMGFLQFCPEGGPLCSVPCLKDLWKKARSPSWSALHSSACWEPIALICGMSVPRRSNIPETFCFPASMI